MLSRGDLDAHRRVIDEELNADKMTGNERVATHLDGRRFSGGSLGWDVFSKSYGYISLLGADNRGARTFGAALGLVPAKQRRAFFEVSLEAGLLGQDLALCYAAEFGDDQLVEWLLDEGADPDPKVTDDGRAARTKFGFRPLHLAALGGHPQVVRRLIDHGVPVDQAAEHSDQSLIRIYAVDPSPLLLLASQIDTRQAHAEGQWQVAELLLELGADPLYATEGKPSSPLEAAMRRGHQGLYDLLGELGGVDIDDHPIASDDDKCPMAALTGLFRNRRSIAWALDAGWRFRDDERDGRWAATAFEVLAGKPVRFAEPTSTADDELRALVTRLIEEGGADPNARTFTDVPNFVNVCHVPAIVETLVDYGVDPNALSTRGASAVFCLVEAAVRASKSRPKGSFGESPHVPGWLRVVLEAGAQPEVHECEGNVLEMALRTADRRVIELLVDHGADPSKLAPHQQVRVWAAIGDIDAVADLLASDDDLAYTFSSVHKNFGPYVLAAMGGHPAVVELLREHGHELDREELSTFFLWVNTEQLNVEICDLLAEALSAKMPSYGGEVIAWAIRGGSSDIARRLLQGPYEPSATDLCRALTEATKEGDQELVEALLDHELLHNLDDKFVVRAALEADEAEISELLLDRKASLPDGDEPAWCLVAENGSARAAEILARRQLGDPLATRARDGKSALEIVEAKLPRLDDLADPREDGDRARALKHKYRRVARTLRQLGAGDVDRTELLEAALSTWREAMQTHRRDWPEWGELEAAFADADQLEWGMADGVEYLVHPERSLAVPVPSSLPFEPDELLHDWFWPLSGADTAATSVSGGLLSHAGRHGAFSSLRGFYPEISAAAPVPKGGLYTLQHNRSGTPVFADAQDRVRVYDAGSGQFEIVGSVDAFIRYCLAQLLSGRHWSDGYAAQRDLEAYELTHVPFVE